MKTFPKAETANIVQQSVDGELLLYNLTDNKAFCLNETSALVWQFCDGNKSVAEISLAVGEKLKSPISEDFVWLALDKLKQTNLLVNNDEMPDKFKGLSRREVIRKVGLSSMAALPVILVLTAPTAIQAASCFVGVLTGTAEFTGATQCRAAIEPRCCAVGTPSGCQCPNAGTLAPCSYTITCTA